MSDFVQSGSDDAFAVLRRFARKRAREERCELCASTIGEEHQHLLEITKRQISCACIACAVLFCGQEDAHYRRIPTRIRMLPDAHLSDMQWESLMLPINLAFFYRDSSAERTIAMYPSPAGATESMLELDAWAEIVADNPELQKMESDVEAFIVNRIAEPHQYFVVPIDECFRLVGLIRLHWRGLSGGAEVWAEIERFFAELTARSVSRREVASARS